VTHRLEIRRVSKALRRALAGRQPSSISRSGGPGRRRRLIGAQRWPAKTTVFPPPSSPVSTERATGRHRPSTTRPFGRGQAHAICRPGPFGERSRASAGPSDGLPTARESDGGRFQNRAARTWRRPAGRPGDRGLRRGSGPRRDVPGPQPETIATAAAWRWPVDSAPGPRMLGCSGRGHGGAQTRPRSGGDHRA